MKRRTRLMALLLTLVMAATMGACGGTTAPAATPSATPAASSVEATPEASPEATPEPEKKEWTGTITINTQAGPGAAEAWNGVAAGYMAKNPGVKVVVDLKPAEGYAEWIQGMFGNADPTADIVNINLAGPAAAGKAINFMEYADMESPYSGGPWTEQFNYEMQTKDLARNEWTSLSLESVQVLWTYNKDIFEEVGVTPPKTWDEFIAVCDKLLAAGYQPLSMSGDFNSFWAMQMGWLAQIYMDQTTRSMLDVYRAQKGDYNYDPDMDGVFKLDVADPFNDDPWKVNQNVVRAFKAVRDGVYKPDSEGAKTVWTNFAKMFPKYAGGKAFFGTKDSLPLFYQGKAAIFLDGAWRLAQFKRDMDLVNSGKEVVSNEKAIEGVKQFRLGTFNMPSMQGPGIEAPARTIEVAIGFLGAVSKDKEHNDLVMDFLMYYSSEEGFSQYMAGGLGGGWTPAGPALVKGVSLPAEYADLFSELDFIGNAQKGYGQMISRGAPGDVQQSLRDWYGYSQELLEGKITVDQWAAKHKENVMKYLPDALAASKINASDLDNPQNAPTGK